MVLQGSTLFQFQLSIHFQLVLCVSILNISFIITVLKNNHNGQCDIILASLSFNDTIISILIIPFQVYHTVLPSQRKLWCSLETWFLVSMFSCSLNSFSLIVLISAEKYVSVLSILVRKLCDKASSMFCLSYSCINTPYNAIHIYHFPTLFDAFASTVGFIAFAVFSWCQEKIFLTLYRIRKKMIIITFSVILCYYVPTIYGVYSSTFGRSQVCTAMARRPFCVRHIQTDITVKHISLSTRLSWINHTLLKLYSHFNFSSGVQAQVRMKKFVSYEEQLYELSCYICLFLVILARLGSTWMKLMKESY